LHATVPAGVAERAAVAFGKRSIHFGAPTWVDLSVEIQGHAGALPPGARSAFQEPNTPG
jgi:hypothetical protein